jgi:hypothetical protein|tara:strand:- start:354 stop:1094 length:741 start_codon:yes stop_codon:yes gene_type:complete
MTSEAFNGFSVWLELARRNDVSGERSVNRIPLFATEIQINSSKMVVNTGIPFSAMTEGESVTIAYDIGQTEKTLSISGLLLNQTIVKDSGSGPKSRVLTSFEMAQLIHSYVDSSQLQDDQYINKLIVLIPSRVDSNFDYRNEGDATADITDLPKIPFTYKNRNYDNSWQTTVDNFVGDIASSLGVDSNFQTDTTDFFADFTELDEILGMEGFINNFSTTLSGEQFPAVQFSFDFEVARVIADNPLN